MKKNIWISLIGIFIFFNLNLLSFAIPLNIPLGKKIIVNGIMEPDEWGDALETDLKGGKFVKLKQDGSYLYLCIKGKNLGIGIASVCINTGDTITILHASTGLITAIYKLKGKNWQQVEGFRSEKQRAVWKEKNKESQNKRHLVEYLWLANTLPMRIPGKFSKLNVMEYKISLHLLKNGASKMSVVLFQHMAKPPFACLPKDLKDDSLNRRMVSGSNIQQLKFKPESWPVLKW